eukprot:scaffold30428_cov30-Cyclotella_meneghiniana.AAC.1
MAKNGRNWGGGGRGGGATEGVFYTHNTQNNDNNLLTMAKWQGRSFSLQYHNVFSYPSLFWLEAGEPQQQQLSNLCDSHD